MMFAPVARPPIGCTHEAYRYIGGPYQGLPPGRIGFGTRTSRYNRLGVDERFAPVPMSCGAGLWSLSCWRSAEYRGCARALGFSRFRRRMGLGPARNLIALHH